MFFSPAFARYPGKLTWLSGAHRHDFVTEGERTPLHHTKDIKLAGRQIIIYIYTHIFFQVLLIERCQPCRVTRRTIKSSCIDDTLFVNRFVQWCAVIFFLMSNVYLGLITVQNQNYLYCQLETSPQVIRLPQFIS